jgi:hypothetical protein
MFERPDWQPAHIKVPMRDAADCASDHDYVDAKFQLVLDRLHGHFRVSYFQFASRYNFLGSDLDLPFVSSVMTFLLLEPSRTQVPKDNRVSGVKR